MIFKWHLNPLILIPKIHFQKFLKSCLFYRLLMKIFKKNILSSFSVFFLPSVGFGLIYLNATLQYRCYYWTLSPLFIKEKKKNRNSYNTSYKMSFCTCTHLYHFSDLSWYFLWLIMLTSFLITCFYNLSSPVSTEKQKAWPKLS